MWNKEESKRTRNREVKEKLYIYFLLIKKDVWRTSPKFIFVYVIETLLLVDVRVLNTSTLMIIYS